MKSYYTPDRWIGSLGKIERVPRSPDLNHSEFLSKICKIELGKKFAGFEETHRQEATSVTSKMKNTRIQLLLTVKNLNFGKKYLIIIYYPVKCIKIHFNAALITISLRTS